MTKHAQEAREESDARYPRMQFASAGEKPPPPPGSPDGRQDATAPQRQEFRNRALVAAAAGGLVPPRPPTHPEQERDPNRKYGFIVSVGPDGRERTQNYSYLSEPERVRKCDFLNAHPEYDLPPGDPLNAPKNAQFGFIATHRPGEPPTVETYWYRTLEERELVVRLIRGK